jgi:hypothetical protein
VNAPDNDGIAPLHTVCRIRSGQLEDHIKIAEFLINNGANVNLMVNNNCTPLHRAACNGEEGIALVELLLKHGADITIENIIGWTALHFAYSDYGSEKIGNLLPCFNTYILVLVLEDYIKVNCPHFLETFDPNKPKQFLHTKEAKPLRERDSPVSHSWWIEGLDQSVLSDKRLDRLLGCIYGSALGDAVGLATEFQRKEDIASLYLG